MNAQQSFVVVTRAKDRDYSADCVCLPRNYGSAAYYDREDIQAIQAAVNENLTTLDAQTGFTAALAGKKVLVKPNLVMVLHALGLVDPDYPSTTDPRVIDAVIMFLKQYAASIVIVEASGRGMPTRGSFMSCGLDRLARHHGIGLESLEEQPVDRYILPRAQVMREIVVPRIFSEVATGDAFYVSVPKMKTSFYTDVTLGFKNAMGCLAYNLRQRNHNFGLEEKLVDIMYLIKPGLTVIDGIVGAEGQGPSMTQPLPTRVIISGNNVVETDRVGARMMGFDPDSIELIKTATDAGFGDSGVQVIGTQEVFPFVRSETSLMSDAFHELFPNVRVLVGHQLPTSAAIYNPNTVTPEMARAMQLDCRGGCLAHLRFGFEFMRYEGLDRTFSLTIIIGCGVEIGGQTWYFDRDGQPWSLDDIAALKEKKLVVGSCGKNLKDMADDFLEGCSVGANDPHMALHKLSGLSCKLLTPVVNPSYFKIVAALLETLLVRTRLLRQRHYLDVEKTAACPCCDSAIPELRELTDDEKQMDFVKWDFPPMTRKESQRLIAQEWAEVLKTMLYKIA